MSSAESKSPRSPKTSPSSNVPVNVPISVEPSSAEPMDQHPDSPTIAPPPALPTSPEVMSSTVPDPSDTVSLSQPSPAISPGNSEDSDSSTSESSELPKAQKSMAMRQQPIPPASEPMQYRAIGLVRGKYAPSEEQFTRGFLVTDDGVSIDAVLLGRVMSLVKKHLDLEQSHLWVVYPRTREKEYDLHVQIVGVWEPENLNSTLEADEATGEEAFEETAESDLGDDVEAAIDKAVLPAQTEASVEAAAKAPEEEAASPSETAVEAPSTPGETATEEPIEDFDDRYFSVRGEVVFHSPENEQVLVKIRRIQRQGDKQSKAFKVVLRGALEGGKSVGYFWEFNVQRQENILTIQDATLIKMVPPQKGEGGNKFSRGPRRGAPPGGRKRWDSGSESAPPRREGAVPRPSRPVGDRPVSRPMSDRPLGGDRPVSDRPSRPAVPRERKEPATKPVLKRRNSEPSES